MKIYVTHSTAFDFKEELYKPLRESELNTLHEIILPHEKNDEPFSSKEFIPTCDLIFAEVSYPSTGQGIELGWADKEGRKIICFHKSGTKYSSSLKTICDTFFEYDSTESLINFLKLQSPYSFKLKA